MVAFNLAFSSCLTCFGEDTVWWFSFWCEALCQRLLWETLSSCLLRNKRLWTKISMVKQQQALMLSLGQEAPPLRHPSLPKAAPMRCMQAVVLLVGQFVNPPQNCTALCPCSCCGYPMGCFPEEQKTTAYEPGRGQPNSSTLPLQQAAPGASRDIVQAVPWVPGGPEGLFCASFSV